MFSISEGLQTYHFSDYVYTCLRIVRFFPFLLTYYSKKLAPGSYGSILFLGNEISTFLKSIEVSPFYRKHSAI